MSPGAGPLVSIIIPLYNAGKYIEETIKSALNQTWRYKELIIVDDGSTDSSLEIARRFRSENVKVFSQENKGASAARNLGLREAKGEYIQFLDADDLLSENKIASQLELLIADPGHLGLCTTIHFADGSDPEDGVLKHEWLAEGSDDPADFLIKLYGGDMIGPQYGGMVQPNAWLTPKAVIDIAGPWNEMRNPDDDGEFFCRVILASKGIRYSYGAVNYYRKFSSEGSWSAQKSYAACRNILQTTRLKAAYLLKKTTDNRVNPVLSRLFWENAFQFFPYFRDLSKSAEREAKSLSPSYKYHPYTGGVNAMLAKALGWKTVKYLQYLKHKIA